MVELVKTIATGLIIAIIADLLLRSQGKKSLYSILLNKMSFISGRSTSIKKAHKKGYTYTIKFLTWWLTKDQDKEKESPHYGQFGKRANKKEEKLYQTGAETLQVKPRLYLTRWPCLVLSRKNLLPKERSYTVVGLNNLFKNNIIKVYQGAIKQMDPSSQPTLISYRHTIRGAQMLLELGSNADLVSNVLGLMLDERNKWQNKDGGWAQCDQIFKESDLWASAYAISMLYTARKKGGIIDEKAFDVDSIIIQTIDYFKTEWENNKWAYGRASAEQNAPPIFHEIADVLKKYNTDLLEAVINWIFAFLTPLGTISEEYFKKCKNTGKGSAITRIAYALYLSGAPKNNWLKLYEAAISSFDDYMNSADVSFLLDLTINLQRKAESRHRFT